MGAFPFAADCTYQTLKCNIDLTKVLQIGFAFADAKGNKPKGISTWRFNFMFDVNKDLFSHESIDALRQTRGLDLARHQSQGIDPQLFGELLMSSGLVLNEDVKWVTLGGGLQDFTDDPKAVRRGRQADPPSITLSWMYDFGILLSLLTSQDIPEEIFGFFEGLDLFFPCRCDVSRCEEQLDRSSSGGDSVDPRRHLGDAHCVLEAFFRLPDAVRGVAFDRLAEVSRVPNRQSIDGKGSSIGGASTTASSCDPSEGGSWD